MEAKTCTYLAKPLTETVTAKKTLRGKRGKPLRLFNKNGYPLTDYDGYPLVNISERTLLRSNPNKSELQDWNGSPPTDYLGFSPSDLGFDPEGTPQTDFPTTPILNENGQPQIIFSLLGYPLTDTNGRPLSKSCGKCLVVSNDDGVPVSDLEGHQIITFSSFNVNSSTDLRLLEKKSGQVLLIYDAYGRPLTDSDGFVFADIFGEPLVIFDHHENAVGTTDGSDIYDSEKRCKSDPLYEPTKKSSNRELLAPVFDANGNALLLFDQTGFPLTDLYGDPLVDWNGMTLFEYDSELNKITSRGLDTIQIIASLYQPDSFKSIHNDLGKPARLFNFQGKPLTNWLGEPLKHADGRILIQFDLRGNPKCDFQGLPLYDEYGAVVSDCSTTPFDVLTYNEEMPFFRDSDPARSGITLFDSSGMPVTDHRGFCLTNSSRKYMLENDSLRKIITDNKGDAIFTKCGLPLINSFSEPILNPKGKICQLFDNEGYPLTCKRGYPLRLTSGGYSIEIDDIGRIVGDGNGRPVYDVTGIPMTLFIEFNASKLAKNAKRHMSSSSATLIKDSCLLNIMKNLLVDEKDALHENDFFKRDAVSQKSSFKLRAISSHLNRKATSLRSDNNHRSFSNGSNFKPNGTRQGKLPCKYEKNIKLDSNLQNANENEADSNSKLFNTCSKMFDDESVPSVDHSGEILQTHDSRLALKFDSDGKLVSDYRGRDVYDSDGLPLTNVTGCWKNKKGIPLRIFNECGHPLTDFRGKSLYDINGLCLVGRDEIGRPLLDSKGNVVFDADGIPSGEYTFCPMKQPISDRLCPLLDADETPVRIFDSEGRPLNDENGETLVNDKGMNLLRFNNLGPDSIVDRSGNKVYDGRAIPMGYQLNTPLENIRGSPLRLFDVNGRPLTDFFGFPLITATGQSLIDFDLYGRPHQSLDGKTLYDCNCRILGSPGFQLDAPHLIVKNRLKKIDSDPLLIYDRNDKPLTDRFGNILVNSKGDELVFIESGIPICDIDGHSLFDQSGNDLVIEPNTFVLLVYH